MIALDTNVLVRFLTADDKQQAARAKALLLKHEVCWVPVTVLLELAWVLGGYAWDNGRIARKLRELIGENVINPQHPEAVSRALRWAEAGMAFADALHLALSASASPRNAILLTRHIGDRRRSKALPTSRTFLR